MMTWIQKMVVKLAAAPFLSTQAGIIIRHGMTLLGGYLLALGFNEGVVAGFTGATTDLLIAGVSIGLAWIFSTVNKMTDK